MISNEVVSRVKSNHLLYLPHEIKTMFGFFLLSSLCANKYILVNIFVTSYYLSAYSAAYQQVCSTLFGQC